jgi:hypothetical protein
MAQEVNCWGYNFYGQLGDGNNTSSSVPVDVTGRAVVVAAGGFHSCAVSVPNGLSCWGSNSSGQLGDGTRAQRDAPVAVHVDGDRDGCPDVQESQTAAGSETTGGRRDQKNLWDFFDVPTGVALTRDRSVTSLDVLAVVSRFSSTGDASLDPFSLPAAAPTYHTSYDRGPVEGTYRWSLGAADGSIAASDIFAGLAQLGHSCL